MEMVVAEELFAGGGEMGALMRSLDWSQTLLGSVSEWTQSLKTALSIILTSRYPMFIWWGAEYANLYNDAYRPILGASKHPQFLGQSAKDCWADVWDVVGPLADSVLKTGQPTWSEDLLLLMDRNGYLEETYFTFSYSPVRDESGGVGGVFCAVMETTGQIIGERRLRTLRELAAKTAEAKTVEEACHITTTTLSINPYDITFALLYRVEADGKQAHLAGTTGIEAGTVASPEQVDLLQESELDRWNLAKVNRTGKAELVSNLPTRFGVLPKGAWSEEPTEALVIPIAQSGKAQLAGLLVVGISPRREFDDDYQGFFELIASNVATAIANADTYEAERKRAAALAELDRAKTTFFSNISHEFRTPLTLMLGSVEEILVGNEPLSTHQREQLEVAQRNSLRLLKLVNTLLDFSRLEAGRIQAVYEPTDLATFTRELASVFRSAIERAGMQLVVDCPPLPEPIYLDREMWEKIVLNLLSNAFKFTFEGKITVALRSGTDHVELDVSDTGIGIPENELPRLFERFHRVPGARGRTYEGSGIGLSLVQELVRLHGGTLRVASVEAQGSCFTVSIPAGFVHLPQNQIGATQTLTSTATQVAAYVEEALRWLPEEAGGVGGEENLGENRSRGSGGREELMDVISLVSPASPARILLVDDNADIRDYVRRLLSRDYEVEAVSDGLAALDAVQRYLPDLVLTDIMMPRLDGLELLRSLRNDPATQNIPIILLSARAGEESRVEGLEAGADDYLIKPFSARELLARVRTNLDLVRLRQETVRYQEQLRVEAQAAQSQVSNILESITDAFVAFDREWRYTYVNEYATRLLRKKREELLGKQVWTEVFPELVGTKSYWEYHRAIAEQVPIVFEKFSQPMGVWVEVNAYPFPDGLAVYFRDITHRKQAEQALRESEERFRQLAENIDTVFFMSEGFNEASPGRVIYVSPAYERIWGRSCESLYQNTRSWLEAIHPGDRERIGQALPGIARAEFDQEFRIVRPDGEIRWVRDRIFPVYNERGEVYRTAGIVEDITDRKQVEVALQESESRFRNIADHSPIMIWMSAPDGAGVWFNQQWCEFTGQTLEEALGSGWVAAVHPEDAQSIETTCLQAHQRHEPVRLEYRLRRRDGEYRWVFDSAAPRFDDTGVYLGYIGSITDISDVYDELRLRKQAEAELQQTFQTLSTLITASPLPIVVIEPDMTVHLWNPAAEQLFGWSEAEVLGQPIPIVPEEKQDECRQVRKAVAKGEVFAGVETYRCKRDGATVIVSISAAPLSNEEGSLNAVLLIFQDITERKAVEEEREQLLLSEQRAREEAERANRIKDEFLAVLSHELRSPLNPILGWAKLLQSRSFDEQKTKHALATIERNALLQAQLIEDLLDVSRILQGKLVLNTAPVSLTNTIEAALETVRLAAEAKDIQLQCVLDLNVGQVMGESARLQQVIWNLLSNAVKFTPSGGTIEIRLKQINTHAQLQVKDTGKGITREFLPHVFEYFRQEDGTTTRKFGGLGLGLAIVRHLAELHGGTVWAESPGEGQGAIFTVRLPLMPVSTQTPQDNPQVAPIAHLTGLRILVVDDQPDIRDIVAFILEQAGAAVSVAASAPEALNLMEQFIPDLLICDIGMPDIDGYMLMRQIRRLPPEQGGKIPAIALTAYAGEFDRRQALQVGFQKHMSKPVEPEELVKAIVNLVEFV